MPVDLFLGIIVLLGVLRADSSAVDSQQGAAYQVQLRGRLHRLAEYPLDLLAVVAPEVRYRIMGRGLARGAATSALYCARTHVQGCARSVCGSGSRRYTASAGRRGGTRGGHSLQKSGAGSPLPPDPAYPQTGDEADLVVRTNHRIDGRGEQHGLFSVKSFYVTHTLI